MSENKIGKTMEKLAKGLDNFSKLVVANKHAASGDVEAEIASTGNLDPSGVNQNPTPTPVTPENIGYTSQNSESSTSSVEDSDMIPVIEGSDISQTEKGVKPSGKSLDKIISKLETESGISKSKKLKKDKDEDDETTDISLSDTGDGSEITISDDSDASDASDDSDADTDSDMSNGDDSGDTSTEDEDYEKAEDVDEDETSSSSSEDTEKAVYIEVNDLVKSVLSETGLERKISRIEKSLADHEKGFKHLAKAVVQIAKALRSVKNESTMPVRKSVPSVKASISRLSKAVVADKLYNLAKDGRISSTEVLKFETTGNVSEETKRILNQ